MQFNFGEIISELNAGLPFGDNFAYQIARATVVPASYMFNTLLPQREKPDYHISGGNMIITPTMLGQVAMDSPYPPFGAISSSTFFENTTKLGGQIHFPEQKLRELQGILSHLRSIGVGDGLTGSAIMLLEKQRLMDAVIGFANMILKAQWDTYEWLRGLALQDDVINWEYSKKTLLVQYGTPTANIRTNAGANSYHDTTSQWWKDVAFAYSKLTNPRFIMNSNTYFAIVDNDANKVAELENTGTIRPMVRFDPAVVTQQRNARARMTATIYDKSGSVINAKTGELTAIPFLKDGKVIVVGETPVDQDGLTIGSVDDPDNSLELGYTHLAPTVEGGRMGIWSRVFTPELKPYQIQGETASNGLPVIVNPKKRIIFNTAMPA